MKEEVIKKDFLFCQPLTTSTKTIDVEKLVDNFAETTIFRVICFVQFVRTELQPC